MRYEPTNPYGPGYEDEAEAAAMEEMNADEEYYCEARGHPITPDGGSCYCGAKSADEEADDAG